MRPRRFCRGERAIRCRRDGDRKHASMRPRRFCRGERDRVAVQPIAIAASMRPRRFCRGEPRPGRRRRRGRSGFNEAPAILPGRGRCKSTPRSGRRSSFNEAPAILPGRGRPGDPAHFADPPEASMRPRRFCRGEAGIAPIDVPATGNASMRPRRFCRGERADRHWR